MASRGEDAATHANVTLTAPESKSHNDWLVEDIYKEF